MNLNKLFLINTRVWLNTRRTDDPELQLSDIPHSYWNELYSKGFDGVWLLGVWNNHPELLGDLMLSQKYINQYKKIVPDLRDSDIIDSCFAVDDYKINPMIGDEDEILSLKHTLNSIGLKLILDFVPNHFHCYSSLIADTPDAFLVGNKEILQQRPNEYYTLPGSTTVLAHGRDPYSGSWEDTVQVNWFSRSARAMMLQKLTSVSRLCDGVRVDMAMLNSDDQFGSTWGYYFEQFPEKKEVTEDWWGNTISTIKQKNNDFLFIGECYWNKQSALLESGFDYVYDKQWYDAIVQRDSACLDIMLKTKSYLPKSVVFLENHDEPRIASVLENKQIKPAAVLLATLPGLKLYQDGQEQGFKHKVPMQIGRGPEEVTDAAVKGIYKKITELTNLPVFMLGDYEPLDSIPIDSSNPLLAYKRTYQQSEYIIAINFSPNRYKGHIPYVPQVNDNLNTIIFKDILTGNEHSYSRNLLFSHHLYIELQPWHSHIFEVIETR